MQFYEMQHKGEGGGSLLLTRQQQEWLQIQRAVGRTKVLLKHGPPNSRLRAAVFDVVMNRCFDGAVMAVIVLNVATMALNHQGQGQAWDNALSWANLAFTLVFVAEAALKVVAIGAKLYFAVSPPGGPQSSSAVFYWLLPTTGQACSGWSAQPAAGDCLPRRLPDERHRPAACLPLRAGQVERVRLRAGAAERRVCAGGLRHVAGPELHAPAAGAAGGAHLQAHTPGPGPQVSWPALQHGRRRYACMQHSGGAAIVWRTIRPARIAIQAPGLAPLPGWLLP
jgi:hypothetical protein